MRLVRLRIAQLGDELTRELPHPLGARPRNLGGRDLLPVTDTPTPPSLRKSGRPDSVETPAPVSTTIFGYPLIVSWWSMLIIPITLLVYNALRRWQEHTSSASTTSTCPPTGEASGATYSSTKHCPPWPHSAARASTSSEQAVSGNDVVAQAGCEVWLKVGCHRPTVPWGLAPRFLWSVVRRRRPWSVGSPWSCPCRHELSHPAGGLIDGREATLSLRSALAGLRALRSAAGDSTWPCARSV